MRVHTVGHELREEALDNLVSGRQLPAEILFGLGSIAWHPDDYVGFAYEAHHKKMSGPASRRDMSSRGCLNSQCKLVRRRCRSSRGAPRSRPRRREAPSIDFVTVD